MNQTLVEAIRAAAMARYGLDVPVELSRPDARFGDVAVNTALRLAKQVGRPPRDIAEELAADLRAGLAGTVSEVGVAGPGFINLRLDDTALVALANQEIGQAWAGKTVVAEYSDPNPFKPLHAGHLYTTLVGDTVSRLLEAAGATVIRVNYGGDVGLHVGKSMWAILGWLGGEHPDKLTDIPESDRPTWLGMRYVEGNTAYENDEAAKAEVVAVNRRIYQLHAEKDHSSAFAQIYWACREWSYAYFAALYDKLHVKPFDRYLPESEVTPLGLATVREQLAKGVYRQSDGAVIYDGEAAGLHTRVFINSAGLPTYETKDVGLILTKWQDYHFDQSIIITANEQSQYFEVMLHSVKAFAPEPVNRTRHLSHGVIKFQGGAKFSSRKGNGVRATDILVAARTAAAELQAASAEAGRDGGWNTSEDTVLAAVKYAFARNRIGGDIAYDPKESIALEGNSGPYLQYAHARACSILRKAPDTAGADATVLTGLQVDERALLRKLSGYSEAVDRAVTELMPHHVCAYLYELAQEFNRFYEHNPVLGDPRQVVRLRLVQLYAGRLKQGLALLGITAPDSI